MAKDRDYEKDVFRYYGKYKESFRQKLCRPNGLRYLKVFRKYNQCHNVLIKKYYSLRLERLKKKTLIQIPQDTRIGKGLYIGHDGAVIVNSKAVIGDNCNIAAGVTIGQENRGKRKGCPTISNDVWIGINAVIVGKIKIGNDVLIAPLSYVNFDVPDHSIVVGNPGKIIPRKNATEGYIDNVVSR